MSKCAVLYTDSAAPNIKNDNGSHSHPTFTHTPLFTGYNEIHPPELLETLKQRDMYSVGVTESFYAGWKHMAKAEKSYNEIVDMSSIGYRRSDITTDSSMKLYSSFFDQSSEISPVRIISFFVYL